MAQSIPSFVHTRLPEALAARSTDSAQPLANEEAAGFGSHLAAEKPPLHRRAQHANRDIEDIRREAARDAAPRASRAAAETSEWQKASSLPKSQPVIPAGAERNAMPKGASGRGENIVCDKPDRSAQGKPDDAASKPMNVVCDKEPPVEASTKSDQSPEAPRCCSH